MWPEREVLELRFEEGGLPLFHAKAHRTTAKQALFPILLVEVLHVGPPGLVLVCAAEGLWRLDRAALSRCARLLDARPGRPAATAEEEEKNCWNHRPNGRAHVAINHDALGICQSFTGDQGPTSRCASCRSGIDRHLRRRPWGERRPCPERSLGAAVDRDRAHDRARCWQAKWVGGSLGCCSDGTVTLRWPGVASLGELLASAGIELPWAEAVGCGTRSRPAGPGLYEGCEAG